MKKNTSAPVNANTKANKKNTKKQYNVIYNIKLALQNVFYCVLFTQIPTH